MNWILVLSLVTGPDGFYTQEFKTEAECVTAFKDFVSKNTDNPIVEGVACLNGKEFALNTEMRRDRG